MQSIKNWLVRHSRSIRVGSIFTLLFVLVRTAVGFWLSMSPTQPTTQPTSITWAEVVLGFIVAGALGVLTSVVITALRRLPLLQGPKIRVGAERIQVDIENVERTMRLLEEKIGKMQETPHVFLSRSFQDREFAKRLAEDLKSQAIEIWLPEQQIEPGDLIDRRIRQGVEESQWFLVIISPSALESDWVHKELAVALQAEKARGRSFVVPILYKGDEVFAALGDREYIDFRTDYQGALRRLAERLIASMRSSAKEEMTVSLDDALLAWDRGEIDQVEVEAITQTFALAKWLQGDAAGWYELWEQVRFGGGLRPVVRSALKRELRRVRQGIPRPGMPTGYEERLRSLLSPQSVE